MSIPADDFEYVWCDMSKKKPADIIAGLLVQVQELEHSLKLIHDSDMRAIKLWQLAHPGQDHVWPDRAEMIFWLLEDRENIKRDLILELHKITCEEKDCAMALFRIGLVLGEAMKGNP